LVFEHSYTYGLGLEGVLLNSLVIILTQVPAYLKLLNAAL